jgi:hypothetical protein
MPQKTFPALTKNPLLIGECINAKMFSGRVLVSVSQPQQTTIRRRSSERQTW